MTAGEFTVADGLAWLGITPDVYEKSWEILEGRHVNPIMSALLDARKAQGTDTTPEQVLARHGIDPTDPLAAVRRYDRDRARFDS